MDPRVIVLYWTSVDGSEVVSRVILYAWLPQMPAVQASGEGKPSFAYGQLLDISDGVYGTVREKQ